MSMQQNLFDPCHHEYKDIGGGIQVCQLCGHDRTVRPVNAVFFKYKDDIFVRGIPAKSLFNSTMVHEVVNRGDVFATNLRTGILTIISGKETPLFLNANIECHPKP